MKVFVDLVILDASERFSCLNRLFTKARIVFL